MSDLQNLTPANTYKALLQIGDYTDGISGDTGGNALQVTDGAGNNTALAISTDRVGIGTTSPTQELDVNGDIVSTTLTTSGAVTAGSVSTSGAVGAGSIDVSGNVVADEYALDQTGSSSSAVAIHAPATNELAIRTNSAERVRIDSSGNVGIGTTNPDGKLEVNSDDFDTLYLNRNDSTGSASIILKNNGASGGVVQSAHGGGLKFFNRNSSGALTSTMDIDSAGNVGIGVTDPSTKLEVKQDTAVNTLTEAMRIIGGNYSSDSNAESFKFFHQTTGENTNRGTAFKSIDGSLHIQTIVTSSNIAEPNDLCLQPEGGSVGIGTDDPTAPLEITSTTGGVIMPRMTTTQMNAISSPTDGEMIYNTTANKFYGRANGAWVALH